MGNYFWKNWSFQWRIINAKVSNATRTLCYSKMKKFFLYRAHYKLLQSYSKKKNKYFSPLFRQILYSKQIAGIINQLTTLGETSMQEYRRVVTKKFPHKFFAERELPVMWLIASVLLPLSTRRAAKLDSRESFCNPDLLARMANHRTTWPLLSRISKSMLNSKNIYW